MSKRREEEHPLNGLHPHNGHAHPVHNGHVEEEPRHRDHAAHPAEAAPADVERSSLPPQQPHPAHPAEAAAADAVDEAPATVADGG